MREQHDTRILEQVIITASDRLSTPVREIEAASQRLTDKAAAAAQLDQTRADASARVKTVLAQTLRAGVIILAIALLVLALGYAGRMLLQGYAEHFRETATTSAPVPQIIEPTPVPGAGAPVWPNAPQPSGTSAAEEAIVTTNFTLFREKVVKIGTRSFEVTAGHHFEKDTDTEFQRAWCYIDHTAGAKTLNLSLGSKLPDGAPVPHPASPIEKRETGLSDQDIRRLFDACPWLDGNPDLSQKAPKTNRFVFDQEVTDASVARLITAVRNGATVVEFASPGGALSAALQGHDALRAADVETVATGPCASACTILFLGGSKRSVTASGQIGVHQWDSIGGEADESEAQALSGTLVDLFKQAGVAEEFFIAGSQTPPDEIYWLTRAELQSWGVTTP